MSPFRILALLALAAAASAALPAAAQTASTTFQVRITITSVCTIDTPAATDVDFGSTPSTGVDIDSAGQLNVLCTPGTAYNIGLDGGQNAGPGGVTDRNMSNGAELVPYQLYSDPGRATIWGNTVGTDTVADVGTGAVQIVPVYGRVASANQVAGDYLDVVTATITY